MFGTQLRFYDYHLGDPAPSSITLAKGERTGGGPGSKFLVAVLFEGRVARIEGTPLIAFTDDPYQLELRYQQLDLWLQQLVGKEDWEFMEGEGPLSTLFDGSLDPSLSDTPQA